MIIEDKVKLKRKMNTDRKGRKYPVFFITFSVKYSEILSKFEELHNVLLLTPNTKIEIPKAKLTIYSYYYRESTGEKVPQFSIFLPGEIAETLWEKGERNLKVIVELPDLKS